MNFHISEVCYENLCIFFFLTLKNEPIIRVLMGLAFGLLTNTRMNLNTGSHDKRPVCFQKWINVFISSKSATSTINSKHNTRFFLLLSHALSCMLSHANYLPGHCSPLELQNERISYWRCLEEKLKSFPWVILLVKAKMNIQKPIVGTKRKRNISQQNTNLANESNAFYLLLRSRRIISKQHPAISLLLL